MSDLRTALLASGAVRVDEARPARETMSAATTHRCACDGCNAPAQVAYGYCVRCAPPIGRSR